jgi:phosphoglycolate phosphatase
MRAGVGPDGRRPAPLAALFDLDGTLLDTAPDIAHALNRLRAEHGRDPLPFDLIRPQVSHGSFATVRAGFPDAQGDAFESLRLRFLDLYLERIAVETRLFDGFEQTLQRLEAADVPWGIVTNKVGWLTDPLLRALELDRRAGCMLAGDSLDERKPHPRPLRVAAALLDVAPEACIFVGDARRDIDAARAAGMRALGASFGYLGAEESPELWQADGWLDRPTDLLAWFGLPT